MPPHSHPPGWVEAVGWASLGLAFASALIVGFDVFGRGYRQRMWIMNLVYPISCLYWGLVGLWFYWAYGRRTSTPMIERFGEPDADAQPRWQSWFKAVSHCGAGCTIGDIWAEWLVWALGWTAFAISLPVDFAMDFLFAWTLGVAFQYFTIVPMRDVGKLRGVWAAMKADSLSIAAFQVGLFAGMAAYQQLIWSPGLPKTTATYWMMMQLAMIVGFFTAIPANNWLIRKGWKEKM